MKNKLPLSTAIIEGAKLRPQKFGPPYPGDTASCAVVAALEAVTGSLRKAIQSYERDRTEELFPVLNAPVVRCPSRGCTAGGMENLQGLIFHLNDEHKWKRERIAAFVAKREAKA